MQLGRLVFISCLALALSGCSLTGTAPPTPDVGISLQGRVHGGQQPVVGSHVYLMAANTTGYGQASVSLLNAADTGYSDSIGAYVPTGSDGSFSITGDYSCTPNTQVYLYALGGNPGAGVNPAAGFLAILGNCPSVGNFASAIPYIWVNEVSTIAAAYAMAGFASDPLHVSSSGTALAQIGIANAFANAANLASLSTGVALATTPAGNGTVPQAEINTLANALASCVNSSGAVTGPTNPTTCYTLFSTAGAPASVPTDTATAAIDIAEYQAAFVGTYNDGLFNLASATPAFVPALQNQIHDYSIAISFSGGGLADPQSIAIDGIGNVWVANANGGSVTELSSTGAAISSSTGFIGGGLSNSTGIAIDLSGNVWVSNSTNSITKLSNSGTAISPSTGYTGGGLMKPEAIAIDASGNIWVANFSGNSASEFSNSGSPLSTSTGYTGGGLSEPGAIAIDVSGNAWIANNTGYVTKLSSSGIAISPSTGYKTGAVFEPRGIALDASGDAWMTNSYPFPGLSEISNSGATISTSAYTAAYLSRPFGIAIDGYGNAWVADAGNSFIEAFYSNGNAYDSFTDTVLSNPTSIAIDPSGNAWVANSGNSTVSVFIGIAAPVVTPLSIGVKNNTLGTLP